MAEFTGGNEKYISAREPIVFENETESKYEVCAGIVFHKSGIYEVSVVGNRTIVSEVPKPKTGKWIKRDVSRQIHGISCSAPNYQCSVCKKWWFHNGEGLKWYKFCPECGADMRGERDGR